MSLNKVCEVGLIEGRGLNKVCEVGLGEGRGSKEVDGRVR